MYIIREKVNGTSHDQKSWDGCHWQPLISKAKKFPSFQKAWEYGVKTFGQDFMGSGKIAICEIISQIPQ